MIKLFFGICKIARFAIFLTIGLGLIYWAGISAVTRGYHNFIGTKTTATLHQQISICEIHGKGDHRGKTISLETKCVDALTTAKRKFGENNYRFYEKTNLKISYPTAQDGIKNLVISSADLRVAILPLAQEFEAIYDSKNPEKIQLPLTLASLGFYASLFIVGLIFTSSALYQIIRGQTLTTTIFQRAIKKKEQKSIPTEKKEPHF